MKFLTLFPIKEESFFLNPSSLVSRFPFTISYSSIYGKSVYISSGLVCKSESIVTIRSPEQTLNPAAIAAV